MESEFYLQARREWDERYGDLVLGKRNWQIASAGLMLLSLILALGMVYVGARTKVIPYVVEVDKLGYALTVPSALNGSSMPATVDRMKRFEIAAFIRDARSVVSDPVVEQERLNDLLAHTRGAANKFLESYSHADDFAKNPFQLMKHQTVSVQIESILQASPKSYEVRWSETALDMSGAPPGPRRINMARDRLFTMLREAQQDGLIADNPVRHVRRLQEPVPQIDPFTLAEVEKLLERRAVRNAPCSPCSCLRECGRVRL